MCARTQRYSRSTCRSAASAAFYTNTGVTLFRISGGFSVRLLANPASPSPQSPTASGAVTVISGGAAAIWEPASLCGRGTNSQWLRPKRIGPMLRQRPVTDRRLKGDDCSSVLHAAPLRTVVNKGMLARLCWLFSHIRLSALCGLCGRSNKTNRAGAQPGAVTMESVLNVSG